MLQLEGRFLAKKRCLVCNCARITSSTGIRSLRSRSLLLVLGPSCDADAKEKPEKRRNARGGTGQKSGEMMVDGADGDSCGASSLVPVERGSGGWIGWQRPAEKDSVTLLGNVTT